MKVKKNYSFIGTGSINTIDWELMTYKCVLCKKSIEGDDVLFCGNNEYQCQECFDILENLGKNNG